MAQKVEVTLVDDLDGSEAQETVAFGLDGRTYEIDLSGKNEKKFRDFLMKYVEAGRRTGGKAPKGTNRKAAAGGNSETAAIRAWAKENGHEVSARGRVPASIQEAYKKANA
ncbi:Lsr2 family protein [Streptomyces sp. NBC_00237]|uniref:histone-like nucleoid-structuring protein Lsr2 n=1 Tax=Streptomyces sp. NBC_00237 TaxID=2975687 RepID=UPI0022534170|nr:Lsr2 family protein [Streptomyces sp. NBC_00237]MCX5201476.1 Lsr2 family protein [Streptomyces sp. NBC_00237]